MQMSEEELQVLVAWVMSVKHNSHNPEIGDAVESKLRELYQLQQVCLKSGVTVTAWKEKL